MGPANALRRTERPVTADERTYYDESRRVYTSWFAAIYDVICLPLHWLRRRVAWLARIRRGMRVIDVATGTGAQARAFSDAGAAVVGIDLSPRMLSIARRKHPSVEFREGDATALAAADASFDAACISFALHEMPADVRRRVIGELARVVRSNGTVIVVDYAPPRGWLARLFSRVVALFERTSYHEFLQEDLAAALARAGIEVVDDQRSLFGVARIVIARRAGESWSS
jgi:demethylmenaquinone methyltransferase/2-methoxy-6-polyprenyl-1,4-benzoquinol methylase